MGTDGSSSNGESQDVPLFQENLNCGRPKFWGSSSTTRKYPSRATILLVEHGVPETLFSASSLSACVLSQQAWTGLEDASITNPR